MIDSYFPSATTYFFAFVFQRLLLLNDNVSILTEVLWCYFSKPVFFSCLYAVLLAIMLGFPGRSWFLYFSGSIYALIVLFLFNSWSCMLLWVEIGEYLHWISRFMTLMLLQISEPEQWNLPPPAPKKKLLVYFYGTKQVWVSLWI